MRNAAKNFDILVNQSINFVILPNCFDGSAKLFFRCVFES